MYGVPIKNILTGANVIDFDSDTIKVALATASYTPDQDTHDFFNDVTNEITGTGYTAGGATLAGKAVTYDTATNEVRWDASDTSWSTATFTARYAIVYKDTGSAATSPLIALIDFGANVSVTAGTFLITWAATGIAKITVA
jgi:hypothetical protein